MNNYSDHYPRFECSEITKEFSFPIAQTQADIPESVEYHFYYDIGLKDPAYNNQEYHCDILEFHSDTEAVEYARDAAEGMSEEFGEAVAWSVHKRMVFGRDLVGAGIYGTTVECEHQWVDTGTRLSFCKKCNADRQ